MIAPTKSIHILPLRSGRDQCLHLLHFPRRPGRAARAAAAGAVVAGAAGAGAGRGDAGSALRDGVAGRKGHKTSGDCWTKQLENSQRIGQFEHDSSKYI